MHALIHIQIHKVMFPIQCMLMIKIPVLPLFPEMTLFEACTILTVRSPTQYDLPDVKSLKNPSEIWKESSGEKNWTRKRQSLRIHHLLFSAP